MKIRNTGRYSLTFTIIKDERERKIEFDKMRVYLDTGNIATSGITEIDEKEYKLLKEIKEFNKCFEQGFFKEVTDAEINSSNSTEIEVKDKEIAELKKKVAEAPKKEVLEEKDNEIKNLKAQLEALSKKGKIKKEEKETDGF